MQQQTFLPGDMIVLNLRLHTLYKFRSIEGKFCEVPIFDQVRQVSAPDYLFRQEIGAHNDREEFIQCIGHLNGLLAIQCLPQNETEPDLERYVLQRI